MGYTGDYGTAECLVCGAIFTKLTPNHNYCSAQCREIAQKRKDANLAAERKKIRAKSRKQEAKPKKTLSEIAREAREHGMQYGQYVAKMGDKL